MTRVNTMVKVAAAARLKSIVVLRSKCRDRPGAGTEFTR
jgi:hypothetical protein